MTRLSGRRRAFIEHYLTCWNASEAARRAGYKGRPDVAGSRLMGNDSIKAEIERRISELKMGSDEILARLAEQARGEYSKYMLAGGKVDISKMIEDGKAHLIKCITPMKEGDKVEFYDSQSALVHLGKGLGALTERIDHTSGGKPLFEAMTDDELDRRIEAEIAKREGERRALLCDASGTSEAESSD